MPQPDTPNAVLSVAPMMDWTDQHCRRWHRILAPDALLYTEMIHAAALLQGHLRPLAGLEDGDPRTVVQLGGSDPGQLGRAAAIAAGHGACAINLNVGCPSPRVQAGRFGACLMAEPGRVADCVAAMQSACGAGVPVTVKCRLGIEGRTGPDDLDRFVATVAATGCRTFVVHARTAILGNVSAHANRTIPPLQPERVRRLRGDFPHLALVYNGGITTIEQARAVLGFTDGVMVGRTAYQSPWQLRMLAQALGDPGVERVATRSEALLRLADEAERALRAGHTLWSVTRHILGLASGQPGARAFRTAVCAARAGDADTLRAIAANLAGSPGRVDAVA